MVFTAVFILMLKVDELIMSFNLGKKAVKLLLNVASVFV